MWAESPGQKQPAVLHRLDHETAHPGYTFLQNRALGKVPSVCRETGTQFLPDLFVGPKADVFIRLALQIQAADSFCAHAMQGEAAIVIRINQFFG